MSVITAVLLGLEDETVMTVALPHFIDPVKMAVGPRWVTAEFMRDADPTAASAALTIRTVEFHFDRAETEAAQLINPSLVIYRRRR